MLLKFLKEFDLYKTSWRKHKYNIQIINKFSITAIYAQQQPLFFDSKGASLYMLSSHGLKDEGMSSLTICYYKKCAFVFLRNFNCLHIKGIR